MFKWIKKWYKRNQLNKKKYLIKLEDRYSVSFREYYPGKSFIVNKYSTEEYTYKIVVVIEHETKKVYLQESSVVNRFQLASPEVAKTILETYDQYISELQELELIT